jgi:hypothetical protein
MLQTEPRRFCVAPPPFFAKLNAADFLRAKRNHNVLLSITPCIFYQLDA